MIKFITAISDWAYRHAQPRNILFLLLLLLLMTLFVFPYYTERIVSEEGPPLLDLRFGFSAEEAYGTLEAFGEQGRAVYLEMLLVADAVYPLIYGLLLIFLASFFLKRILKPGNEFRVINLLAVDAVIFDFLENAGIAFMIRQFPHRIDFVAGLTSVFNMLKWIMIGLAMLMVLVSMVIYIAKRKHMTTTDMPDA
ncbi:MAG: hypothetical protein EA394_00360 [Bacteroidia bacterium]|nr:MAG: hypothetical protein EA394_00360 [Bacteroidia bacterium]